MDAAGARATRGGIIDGASDGGSEALHFLAPCAGSGIKAATDGARATSEARGSGKDTSADGDSSGCEPK